MRWQLILACFNGPRVFRKYRDYPVANAGTSESPNGVYKTNLLEENFGFLVNAIETVWTILLYTSPFWAVSAAYRRSIWGMSPEFALKLAVGMAFVYGGAYLGRGLGRAVNKDYLTFLQILFAATRHDGNSTSVNANMQNLRKYDFDFRYWPINYYWREKDRYGEPVHSSRFIPDFKMPIDESQFRKLFWDGLSYVVAHSVARRLAYPGTLAPLQAAVRPALEQGRTKLVEQTNGQRYKLRTRTGNEIDSMFVDRRNNHKNANGKILVITCEGNGGFYEVGSATTPLEANFSVLMWNHPGFGGSTGVPWPSEEAAAVDVVMQFALNQLGWDESDIVLFGWSIGGFTATWIGMNYRNVRGLILDATFDDILPLALHTMPRSWAPLVTRTVRQYLNLDIEKQLDQYNGPVLLVRRLKDEIMAVVEGAHNVPEMRKVNRANNLLKKLLFDRYPNIFLDDAVRKLVDDWLAASEDERVSIMSLYNLDADECRVLLKSYVERNNEENPTEDGTFPVLIGPDLKPETRQQLALYLASRYMVDFDSTHCIPLPADKFSVPLHPWEQ